MTGAVGNIISNAIRYANSQIMITLKCNENNIIITIKDDGEGIKDTNHIFDRFAKGQDGNFGLGLSIAQSSMKKMNASIKAFNDDGAVFEIEFSKINNS